MDERKAEEGRKQRERCGGHWERRIRNRKEGRKRKGREKANKN